MHLSQRRKKKKTGSKIKFGTKLRIESDFFEEIKKFQERKSMMNEIDGRKNIDHK